MLMSLLVVSAVCYFVSSFGIKYAFSLLTAAYQLQTIRSGEFRVLSIELRVYLSELELCAAPDFLFNATAIAAAWRRLSCAQYFTASLIFLWQFNDVSGDCWAQYSSRLSRTETVLYRRHLRTRREGISLVAAVMGELWMIYRGDGNLRHERDYSNYVHESMVVQPCRYRTCLKSQRCDAVWLPQSGRLTIKLHRPNVCCFPNNCNGYGV